MRRCLSREMFCLIVVLLALPAEAATKTWLTTADGNWGTTGNWSGGTPVAGDVVYVPPGTPAITAGLNQSAVALGAVYLQAGYTGAVGTPTAYLQLNCTSLVFAGSGQAYVDVGGSTITAVVTASAIGTATSPGLFLKGSALTALAVNGGNVGLAGQPGETSTVTTVRVSGAGTKVTLGAGVSLTTAMISNGALLLNCAGTTIEVFGGTLTTAGSGAITTINVRGGTCLPQSSGTVTNLNCLGGATDTTKFGVPRTVSNLKQNPGASFSWDPNVLTITTRVAPDFPTTLSAIAA
jgi:hypothetical protein